MIRVPRRILREDIKGAARKPFKPMLGLGQRCELAVSCQATRVSAPSLVLLYCFVPEPWWNLRGGNDRELDGSPPAAGAMAGAVAGSVIAGLPPV